MIEMATVKSDMNTTVYISVKNTNTDSSQGNHTSFCMSNQTFTTVYGVLTSILAVCAIFGNILLLVVIKKYPVVRGPNNKYLTTVHLSVTHLILSAVLLTYPIESASINNTFSEVRRSLVITLFIINGAALFLSACKRFFVTCWPFYYYAKKAYEETVLSIILMLMWALSIPVGFSPMFLPQNKQINTDIEMIANWSGLCIPAETQTASAALFLSFTVICVCFHFIMLLMMRRRNLNLGQDVNRIPPAMKVIMSKTLLYIACWVPYLSVVLLQGTRDMPCCVCSLVLIGGFVEVAFSWVVHFVFDNKYQNSLRDLSQINC